MPTNPTLIVDGVLGSAPLTAGWDMRIPSSVRSCRQLREPRHGALLNADAVLTTEPLDSGDSFILQNAHDDAAILCLSVCCFVVSNLFSLSHGARRQHTG